jgi:hypothetical protein
MSHFATGHSWLFHRSQYRKHFGADVPQWLLAFDVPMKLRIIKVALHIVRAKAGGKNIKLHSFWDGAIVGSSDPKAARNAAAKLRAAYPRASMKDRPYVYAGTFESWGREESAPLAVSVAYAGSKLLNSPNVDGAYQLSPEYIANAKATADRQGALAGYRIAEVLVKLLGDQPVVKY